MRSLMCTLSVCAALANAAFVTADEKKAAPSEREQVVKFMKEHVMGKTIALPKTTMKWADDHLESDYQEQETFNNLNESVDGFSFDETDVRKATVYDVDKEGKRVGPGRDRSGTVVWRVELGERVSTKRLTGSARIISRTGKGASWRGLVFLVTVMKVADGKLVWHTVSPGYTDILTRNGKLKPGALDIETTLSIADGKLRGDYRLTEYDVDPDTFKRTPTKDQQPRMVYKEIQQK
jgi:hypothetical protein